MTVKKYSIIIVTHFFPSDASYPSTLSACFSLLCVYYIYFSLHEKALALHHTRRETIDLLRVALVLLPFFRYVTSPIKLAEIARDNSDRKWNNAFLIIYSLIKSLIISLQDDAFDRS